MVINELQASLAAAGVALVVGIFAFNKWQEARHKRMAEKIFNSEHPDVLLDGNGTGGEPAAELEKPPVRLVKPEQEPVGAVPLPRVESDTPAVEKPAEKPAAKASEAPVEKPAEREGGAKPALGDEDVDCVVWLECGEAVAGPLFWPAQQDALPPLHRRLQWFALNELKGEWEALNAHCAGRYRRFSAALQLVDRRGAVSEPELQSFVRGIAQLADRFQAQAELPPLRDIVPKAIELDQFCAQVDVQIGINVVSKDGHGFPGTKLRGMAEAAGLSLLGDGAFHARDDAGLSLYTLTNRDGQPFAAESMRTVSTPGISLSLDVPRIPDGAGVFNRMYLVATQLANSLGGVVVDDNGALLEEKSVAMIRSKVNEFQQAMVARGIQPGSPLSLRLFS